MVLSTRAVSLDSRARSFFLKCPAATTITRSKSLKRTLERIKALGLPADPAAFELWYTYVTGVNEPLNRCINTIIEEKGALSIGELEKIQEDFASHSRLYSDSRPGHDQDLREKSIRLSAC